MKWLFPTFTPNQLGGLESWARTIAKELLARGHAITFLCYDVNCYSELSDQYPDRCTIATPPRILLDSLDVPSVWRAWRFLRSQRVESILIFNATRPIFLPFLVASRFTWARHVVIIHGGPSYPAPVGLGGRYLGGLVRGLHFTQRKKRLFARLAYHSVTEALFDNAEEQEQWTKGFGYANANCRLWLPPIDVRRFSTAQSKRGQTRRALGVQNSFVFGSVARLAPAKSFGDLIRAFAIVRNSVPNAELLLVGDGPEREQLEALTCDLNVAEVVRFVGAQADVVPYLAAMDVFVLSSKRESLGLVIPEAMASGLPVIVTDLPGPRRVVADGEAGLLVPPENPPELAAAMIRLASDPAQRKKLAETGLKQAALFDSGTVVDQLLAWLQDGRRSRRHRFVETGTPRESTSGSSSSSSQGWSQSQ